MYTIRQHCAMMADKVRTGAYLEAIRRSVRPGDVVLDLGTGVGIHAFAACRAGAARVYAMESSEAIHCAATIARVNGLDDRIRFMQGLSTDLDLPEPVDVIVSDLRGTNPLFDGHIPSIVDARHRFLAPGGTLIPASDVLFVALVEIRIATRKRSGSGTTTRWVSTWPKAAPSPSTTPSRSRSGPTTTSRRPEPGRSSTTRRSRAPARTGGSHVERCGSGPVGESPGAHGRVTFTPTRAGTARGLAIWFEATLVDGVTFSTEPGGEETTYGYFVLPLLEPVATGEHRGLEVDLRADLVGDGYIWTWAHPADRRSRGYGDGRAGSVVLLRRSGIAGHRRSLQARHGADAERTRPNRLPHPRVGGKRPFDRRDSDACGRRVSREVPHERFGTPPGFADCCASTAPESECRHQPLSSCSRQVTRRL